MGVAGCAAKSAGIRAAIALCLGAVVFVLGYASGSRPELAVVGAGVVFLVGVIAVDLVALPILAFPCVLLLNRVGGGNGVSISDAVLFLASVCALLQLRTHESRPLRSLLWCVIAYQAALIPALLRNRYTANYLEWAHEAVLVAGALIVGWVVGRRGKTRLALGLYVALCAALGVAAAVMAPVKHFQPVYLSLPGLAAFQKNALGDLCAFGAIVAYARPYWLGWTRRWANLALICCLLGVLATQSRQAMVGVAVGIAIVVVRARVLRRRVRMIILATIPLLIITYVVTYNQLTSNNRFNSAHQRLTWYGDSLRIWEVDRWFGVGLRWWYTDRFRVTFQPPNAELEVLTSAGIVGLAAFLITAVVGLGILWRLDPLYGTVAVAVIAARLAQGQLDLFWVSSQSSLPWLIAGAALGAMALRQQRGAAPSPQSVAPVP